MSACWRVTWREQPEGAPTVTRGEWRDNEDEALRLAEKVVRKGLVVGEVLVYEVPIEGVA